MKEVPFKPSIPDQQFSVQIGDAEYVFRALWNTRASRWFLDVSEINGTPIIRSVAIVLGTFLGRRSTHRLFSEGCLVAIDTTNQSLDAGLDDLGTRVVVRYFEAMEAFAAAVSAGLVS